ncbi:uncharacterized protein LOC130791421 [Actinidia eriantha]|uniref:uncharacterized protein LOC130791421 n=1 Tax=Actinidia eriantha TaxID=165200 RepID=UPI00258BED59|nr:uncharacterized protein LOC130791421 [Actinidia eriantha]
MEQNPSKRQREETQTLEDPKRQKSYTHIISLLEDDDDDEDPNQDFTSILTTLQRELSCDPLPRSKSDSTDNSDPTRKWEEGEDEGERFMRHLLEASDDELGIPNRTVDGDYEEGINCGDEVSTCDGLWELDDDVANYHSLFQSELLM